MKAEHVLVGYIIGQITGYAALIWWSKRRSRCGNNKVNIITAPLPRGSLMLLKDDGNTWKWKGP